jgi:hypothetical protein
MQAVIIHTSGAGADKLEITSYGNGLSYNFLFGEAGAPMRNLFFQGDDALNIRTDYDARENAEPNMLCRDIWLDLLDPYL